MSGNLLLHCSLFSPRRCLTGRRLSCPAGFALDTTFWAGVSSGAARASRSKNRFVGRWKKECLLVVFSFVAASK